MDWSTGSEALEAIREKYFSLTGFSRKDKALITELTQGVVRHYLFLQHNVHSRLDHPECKLPEPVRQALFIGTYQLLCLDRIPDHAAVQESVKLIKDSRYKGFVSLVNAVLRKIADKGAYPIAESGEDPIEHLAITTSTPRWLVESMVKQVGKETAHALFRALNHTPPLTLRANTLRTSRKDLIEELSFSGISATAGQMSDTAVIVRDRVSPREFPSLLEGRCVVQDEGAQMIAPLLSPRRGLRILDTCAAPGGKTGHIAQLVGDDAFIVAADISPPRIRMMVEGLNRLGVTSVRCLMADPTSGGWPFPHEIFDQILLDAPCSGIGVLRRHPEGKWKKDMDTVSELASIQAALITSASHLLRPGGRLLYTTCSLLREENEDVVDHHLSKSPDLRHLDMRDTHPYLRKDIFTPRGELRLWPHLHDCDGFFASLLEKRTA